ncbi:hypothetical protein C8R43DRAFT_1237633 [Mycena crocata]|nr:hypothetical protein C8R43DRAFT_1237633 [Mycena crocata]
MKFIIVLSALLSAVTAVSGLAIADSNVESRYAVYGAEHIDLVRRICKRATGESVGTAADEADEATDMATAAAIGFDVARAASAPYPLLTRFFCKQPTARFHKSTVARSVRRLILLSAPPSRRPRAVCRLSGMESHAAREAQRNFTRSLFTTSPARTNTSFMHDVPNQPELHMVKSDVVKAPGPPYMKISASSRHFFDGNLAPFLGLTCHEVDLVLLALIAPAHLTMPAADTVYGQQTTQTRLVSDTADNLIWDRYTHFSSSHSGGLTSALSRMTFTKTESAEPLHKIVGLVEAESSRLALGKNLMVVVGRSRRMAVESHNAELQQLISSKGTSIGSAVAKTVGDVGAALVASGTRTSLLVLQAAVSTHN